MPCNPFSLIILFSNPFNVSKLGGGEWQGQQRKPELWYGAGAGRAWLRDARASLCFPAVTSPRGGIPNWGAAHRVAWEGRIYVWGGQGWGK